MTDAGVPQRAIDVFTSFYSQLEGGATGMIAEAEVEPLTDLVRASELALNERRRGAEAVASTAVIKLNGGLGTTMGMDRAKSLLPVRADLTFLDIIVGQVQHVRRTHDVGAAAAVHEQLPHARRHPGRARARTTTSRSSDLPLDFLQNREPKLRADDLSPVEWPDDPSLEWCPPGHGDLYTALETSGVLAALLDAGFRYATVSNADNLGAAPDPAMMEWFAASGAPYAAEVCRRTPADVKGGHLVVRREDGRLVLRETAQTPPEDAEAAADLTRHPYFHTNNLWFDLEQLAQTLADRAGILGLPLIRNEKTVDPTDPSSPRVVQIESAMGAAVEVFDGATAIEVDRSRFLPVKTTNDLMLLRSDVYGVGDDFRLRAQVEPALVDLDRRFYATIADFDARVPEPPSLVDATSLTVQGDWRFGRDVVVTGDVRLDDEGTARSIPAGTRLG